MMICEFYKYVVGFRGYYIFVGMLEQFVDKIQEWVDKKVCDGFNIMFLFFLEGIEVFVD